MSLIPTSFHKCTISFNYSSKLVTDGPCFNFWQELIDLEESQTPVGPCTIIRHSFTPYEISKEKIKKENK